MVHELDALPRRVILSYALPSIGSMIAFVLMSLYFFKFATDVLLLTPGLLGFMLGASRLWDAVSDPIAGYLSDRTRSPLGRRRSWMLAAALPLGASLLMLWSPPASLEGAALAAWVGVALLLFYTAYTAYNVPYGALGAELTQSYHERTRLFAYRQVVGAAGLLLALLAFTLLLKAEDPEQAPFGLSSREMATAVGVACGLIIAGSVIWAATCLRERPDYQTRGPVRPARAFGDVFRNPYALRLLFVFAIHHFSIAALSLLGAYLFQYVIKAPTWMAALFVGAYALGVAGSIPLWLHLTRRMGKRACWSASLWGLGVVYSSFFVVFGSDFRTAGAAAVVAACALAAVTGVLSAAGWLLSPSVQADVIDYDEYVTNERKEGAYLAVWSFVEKSASAVAAAVLGVVLQMVGYTPGGEQTRVTQLAILILISLVPGAGHIAAALAFRGFSLDEAEHLRIRSVLDGRAAAPARLES
jgi:GPH family glycoside/pentoside/hexuronide:cation symporter